MVSAGCAGRGGRLLHAFRFLAALSALVSVMTAQTATYMGSSQASVPQIQTSTQNPVLGSVPEAKPTPGVLPLTFRDAIERALRQNLAGLLSEYNTIAARGENGQKAKGTKQPHRTTSTTCGNHGS